MLGRILCYHILTAELTARENLLAGHERPRDALAMNAKPGRATAGPQTLIFKLSL